MDTMIAKHGIPTSDDVNKLREPLSRALTSLSDLESHMGNYLLASQRLTRSGQGETPYHYFELFLVTVSGFPSVTHSMTTYYAQYPAILQQSLETLPPFLAPPKGLPTNPKPVLLEVIPGRASNRSRSNARLASPTSTPTDVNNAEAPTDPSSLPPTPLTPTTRPQGCKNRTTDGPTGRYDGCPELWRSEWYAG